MDLQMACRNDPKFLDQQVLANSVDLDKTDQGLHCLWHITLLLNHIVQMFLGVWIFRVFQCYVTSYYSCILVGDCKGAASYN